MLLLQNEQAQRQERRLKAGLSVYVPGQWAHRTVNTGDVPFICFYSYSPAAGHDYRTIAAQGFRQKVIGPDQNIPPVVSA